MAHPLSFHAPPNPLQTSFGSEHRKRVGVGVGGGGVDAKKEGKGLEAVASIESKGWVPRDIR
jgi:hypothetical protein